MLKDSVVIAAFISVGGMVVTVIANLFFNFFRGKTDADERFFYEVYHKRLSIYEDVIKELMVMTGYYRDILESSSPFENVPEKFETVNKKIEDDMHTLDCLRTGLELYGSPAAGNIMSILRIEMGDHFRRTVISGSDNFVHNCAALLKIIEDSQTSFLEFVRRETGSNMMDKKIKSLGKAIPVKEEKTAKPNKRIAAKPDA